jgi:hypothetical protein
VSAHDASTTPTVHTKAEAATILRVRESWLEREAAARRVPFTMLGGAYHFTNEHLAEIVRINEKLPTATRGDPEAPERPRRTPRERRHADSAPVVLLRPRPRPDGPRRKRTAA